MAIAKALIYSKDNVFIRQKYDRRGFLAIEDTILLGFFLMRGKIAAAAVWAPMCIFLKILWSKAWTYMYIWETST